MSTPHSTVQWFNAVRPIAAQVGVALPSDEQLRARLAAIHDVRTQTLHHDADMLDHIARACADASTATQRAGESLKLAWTGAAGDNAVAALAAAVEQISRKQERLYATVRALRSAAGAIDSIRTANVDAITSEDADSVAGQPISSIDHRAIAENRDAIVADIHARLDAFNQATQIATTAASHVFTILGSAVGAVQSDAIADPAPSVTTDGEVTSVHSLAQLHPQGAQVHTSADTPDSGPPQLPKQSHESSAPMPATSVPVRAPEAGQYHPTQTAQTNVLPAQLQFDEDGDTSDDGASAEGLTAADYNVEEATDTGHLEQPTEQSQPSADGGAGSFAVAGDR